MKSWFCVVALVVVLLLPHYALAGPVHVVDLIEKAREFDNQTVEISGEAIGDIMLRGDKGWVNILDQGTAVGVWATADQLQKIRNLGSYAQRGDTVIVTGTFHRACAEHGGELDIHAEQVIIAQVGATLEHRVDRGKSLLAVALVPVTMIAVWSVWRRRVQSVPNQ